MNCVAGLNSATDNPSSALRVADDVECAERVDQLVATFQQEKRSCYIFLPFIFFSLGMIFGTLFPNFLPTICTKFHFLSRVAMSALTRIYQRLARRQVAGELADGSIERRRSVAARRNSAKKGPPGGSVQISCQSDRSAMEGPDRLFF